MAKTSHRFFIRLRPGHILDVAIVALLVVAAARVLWPRTSASQRIESFEISESDWSELTADAKLAIGPSTAPVTIVEFVDFECPYCGRLSDVLDQLAADYPGKIRLVLRHFPLSFHRNAEPAALAVECAARQGMLKAMYDTVFALQADLANTDWTDVGAALGLSDIEGFARCRSDEATMQSIRSDVDLGTKLGVAATPTVVVNGYWMRSPSTAELRARIAAALKGSTS